MHYAACFSKIWNLRSRIRLCSKVARRPSKHYAIKQFTSINSNIVNESKKPRKTRSPNHTPLLLNVKGQTQATLKKRRTIIHMTHASKDSRFPGRNMNDARITIFVLNVVKETTRRMITTMDHSPARLANLLQRSHVLVTRSMRRRIASCQMKKNSRQWSRQTGSLSITRGQRPETCSIDLNHRYFWFIAFTCYDTQIPCDISYSCSDRLWSHAKLPPWGNHRTIANRYPTMPPYRSYCRRWTFIAICDSTSSYPRFRSKQRKVPRNVLHRSHRCACYDFRHALADECKPRHRLASQNSETTATSRHIPYTLTDSRVSHNLRTNDGLHWRV